MDLTARGLAIVSIIKNKTGITAIEYIASLIAVAIITAVTLIGTNLSTTFNSIANNL